METAYKVVNGTSYKPETSDEVIRILESSIRTGCRLILHYGDTTTGRDWMDDNDMTGRISRSTGEVKIPIIIHNKRSTGGPGVLDACIVRIRTAIGRVDLYRHPKYHQPTFTISHDMSNVWYPWVVESGKVYARFITLKQRSNWIRKMDIKLS